MSDDSERSAAALADLQRRHDEFLRTISHDVRNPLQVILLQAERLQRLLPEAESRERRAADAIALTVRQLDALIKSMVRQARGEAPADDEGGRAAGS
ncbi:MAG TPA: histidine kinase dimerization/phospho-acceptor domain-containing protein [Anaeromyxobacteraceae bacterium]|jgi:signal transduction histidine kinase|nr:histidine kinase dimerization/phospho-acceptor domain-containing protein [Anaeromyxobacteraceae bacterium]